MNPIVAAALWMAGAITCFTSMAIAGREISLSHDTFETMFYRSCVGIVIVVGVTTIRGQWSQLAHRNLGLHLIRNVSHFAGQNLWFFAVGVIPLAQVFAFEFTAPLWVLVLSPIFLNERITKARALAAGIGFVGILILTQPFSARIEPGALAAALAAIGFAGSAVFTRKLTRTETMTSILFYLTVMQAMFGLFCAGFDGEMALPTVNSAPWLILIGIAGISAHFCLTSALRLAPATVVMPMDFIRLPLIALIGWLLYNEALEMAVVLGAALILSANWLNIRASVREAR